MFLIDILFPRFCLGCGHLGTYICPSCFYKLKVSSIERCFYCKKLSPLGLTHPGCLKELSLDGLTSIFVYDGLMKKIIKNIKYRRAILVWDEFIKSITPNQINKLMILKKILSGYEIQPIPLSENRKRKRGFNQSELVLNFINKYLGLKKADYLIRKFDKKPQAELKSKKDRYQNVRGIFALRPGTSVKNKKILLVDDVITTGSTMKEASRIIKKHGASRIISLALTKGK